MPPVTNEITQAKLVKTKDDAHKFILSPAWSAMEARGTELMALIRTPDLNAEPVDDKELNEINRQRRRVAYLAYPPPTDSAMVEMMLRYGEGRGVY